MTDINEVEKWAFPDLPPDELEDVTSNETGKTPDVKNEPLKPDVDANTSANANATFKEQPNPPINEENEKIKLQLEKLQVEMEDKLSVVNNLIQIFQSRLGALSNELCTEVDYVIKKIVKKLIHNEINQNYNIMSKLIEHYSSLIKAGEKILSVHVSPDVYHKIQTVDEKFKDLIVANHELAIGDLIIKTESTSLRAILDETINSIMSSSHVDHP